MRKGLSGEVSGGREFQVNFSGCIHENRVEKKRCIKYTKNGVECSEAFRRLTEKMIGQYMGKNAKKGVSYAWVPNHIQDANGEMAPRAFLKAMLM